MASHPITLTRKELYEKVWSQPVHTLAKEYGISDVGLKKICKRRDIPTPGLGYWAKVAHGKTVRRTPLPPAKPGQSDAIVIYGSSEYGAPHVSTEAEADWVERESQPEYRVTANFTDEYRHPLVLATAERLRKEKTDGWLTAPHGCLAVRVSRAQLARTLSILDALLIACETRGWTVAAEMPPQRRPRGDTFWYPSQGHWTSDMPKERPAETGVIIRKQFVSFALSESGQQAPPTPADIRAWRKQYPYGTGGPPPRLVPAGELLLEIHSHPWVTTRRNFRDTEKKRLEDQLNAVIVGFVRMAAGLRAHALKEAIERRQKARAERRRREEERRREELERNIAHLQKGMERWQWRETAKEFLGIVRAEARRRSLDEEAIGEWLAWADAYINQRGLEGFFDRWRRSDGESSPDTKTRR
jgi:hypothetical protein